MLATRYEKEINKLTDALNRQRNPALAEALKNYVEAPKSTTLFEICNIFDKTCLLSEPLLPEFSDFQKSEKSGGGGR